MVHHSSAEHGLNTLEETILIAFWRQFFMDTNIWLLPTCHGPMKLLEHTQEWKIRVRILAANFSWKRYPAEKITKPALEPVGFIIIGWGDCRSSLRGIRTWHIHNRTRFVIFGRNRAERRCLIGSSRRRRCRRSRWERLRWSRLRCRRHWRRRHRRRRRRRIRWVWF